MEARKQSFRALNAHTVLAFTETYRASDASKKTSVYLRRGIARRAHHSRALSASIKVYTDCDPSQRPIPVDRMTRSMRGEKSRLPEETGAKRSAILRSRL